jgi:uncharacterized protein (TIGR02246 family)
MMTSMRPLLFLALLLSLAPRLATATPSDEDGIRATVSKYVNARNEKATDGLQLLFTPDADQLVSTGEWRHGLDELIRGMMASSHHEQAKSSVSITDLRMLDPNVAIVDGRYRTTSLNGEVRNMWTTFVLKRTPQGWRIAAIRNMNPASRDQSR